MEYIHLHFNVLGSYDYFNRNLNSDYSTLHSEQFLTMGQIFHLRRADRIETRREYYIIGLIVECDWKIWQYYVYTCSYVNAFEKTIRRLPAWKICFRIFHLTGWSVDAERQFRWHQWKAPQRIIFKVRTNNIGRNVKKSSCHWHQ